MSVWPRRPPSLRVVLAAILAAVAVIPVAILAVWLNMSAMRLQRDNVEDQHLLLSRNAAKALSLYARDVESGFRLAIDALRQSGQQAALMKLLADLRFTHICVVRLADGEILRDYPLLGPDRRSITRPAVRQLAAEARTEGLSFSDVRADANGAPTLFLTLREGPNVVIAALGTGYIVELASGIRFGVRGHAAVVDHSGKVLYHPDPQWVRERRDVSVLEPVQRVMRGEAGVVEFHSPAFDAPMIAGFASAPGPRWGVMVPQPLSELVVRARDTQIAALGIAVLGVAVAVLVGWYISGVLTRPILEVAAAARAVAGGSLATRVSPGHGWHTREIAGLAEAFNAMGEEIQRSHREQARGLARAEQANHAKSRFLANISHELRTPLNAIIGFSEIMRAEMFGPLGHKRYKEYASDVHQSAAHLLEVISDILDLSRAEADQITIEPGVADVGRALQACLSLVAGQARAGGVTLGIEVAPGLPAVQGDERRLRQVFLNLLSNAVKFTERGGRVDIAASMDEHGDLIVTVTDTGVGIAAEDLPRVFEPFAQIENPLNRRHHGTGLGLAISRRLVELHDGTLSLQSKRGYGTTARVVLPRARMAGANRPEAAAE